MINGAIQGIEAIAKLQIRDRLYQGSFILQKLEQVFCQFLFDGEAVEQKLEFKEFLTGCSPSKIP